METGLPVRQKYLLQDGKQREFEGVGQHDLGVKTCLASLSCGSKGVCAEDNAIGLN